MIDDPNLVPMAVAALAADSVDSIAPDATVREVAKALSVAEIGVLVVGEGSSVEGIVSERDVVRAVAEGLDPDAASAGTIAHRNLVWCDASATIAEVANEMMEHYLRHVLLEEDGRLVGIVSMRDLLGAYAAADTTAEA
jgi:CBS domain-containing protein